MKSAEEKNIENFNDMTSIELKKTVIQRILEINDISFLKAINTIVESKQADKVLSLNNQQRGEIILSQKEIRQGKIVEHEVLEKEFLEWLNEK